MLLMHIMLDTCELYDLTVFIFPDLVHIQKSFLKVQSEPYLLKRFTPQPVESLSELQLMPVYILVNSTKLMNTLELYIAQVSMSTKY